MGASSKIEWCDHTFNPWRGCTKVHEGCAHCYAEREAKRFPANRGIWGPNGTRVKASNAMWKEPLKWNRTAEAAGQRRRVFCASLADVFEGWQGPILDHLGRQLFTINGAEFFTEREYPECRAVAMDDLRRDLFALIDATPMLDWLLLTKRPENVRRMWPAMDDERPIFPGAPGKLGESLPCKVTGAYRPNVWLGTSVSNQETADKFVPSLLKCRDLCPVLFLSAEPLLGPINLTPHVNAASNEFVNSQGINCDWVIVGGESGHGARPCRAEYVLSLVEQCQAAGVPCFVKQLGSKPEGYTGDVMAGLHDRKGGNMDEWPKMLRLRQLPERGNG